MLNGIFPGEPTSEFTSSGSDIEYVQVTGDATVNAGLPMSFSFVADDFAGTETDMRPRSGATVFYDSTNLGTGVAAWDFNFGRVVNISTVAGAGQMADENYTRLLSNLVDWSQRE